MHLGKPEVEQLSTVLGGAFSGILACHTNSILWDWGTSEPALRRRLA
jgi:hypothetical protein